jgi:metallo-beta-lactamase family protein
MASLQFLGATGTVTGSKYVLESGKSRLMVDCGLFQGLKDLRLRNWSPLPVNPASINWVALTHGHIDHTGYLPRLVNDGFDGEVLTSEGTAALLKIMLPDSGRLQEEDAEYANRKGYSKHAPALPLYTEKDAYRALKLVRGVEYGERVTLGKSIAVRFVPAGHILGSSFVVAEVHEAGTQPFSMVFSGDLGRYDEPILKDPSPIREADYLLIESTYGNRRHETEDPKLQLAKIINETVERGGKVIIPAFAVGRTQLLVYYLRELEDAGMIPTLPVVVDSPMASATTKLYVRHREDHDAEMLTLADQRRNPLATRNFSFTQNIQHSKNIAESDGPAIIISASGMATGGRVLHHLAAALPNERNTVVLAGYQAAGTRGKRLFDGESEIKIHGDWVPVRARVETIGGLSAHADADEILRWLGGFVRPPKRVFIVHGEPESSAALKARIERELGWNTHIPTYCETAELSA